jgi:hypothetical protein
MSVMQARDDRTILAVDRTEVAEARALSESLAEVRQTSAAVEFEIGPQGGRRVVPGPVSVSPARRVNSIFAQRIW